MNSIATGTPKPPPTFESVWALCQENAAYIKETGEQMRRTDELMRKNEEQRRKTDEQMRRTDEQLKEMFARVDRVSKNIGGVNNSLGEIVAHMLASGIISSFKELGFTFDKMTRETIVIAPGGQKRSVDMELHNGRDIMLIEIKAKPNDEDVEDHVERIQFLRNLGKYTELNVYGAIAGAVFSESAKKYALKKGFFVIEQSGDTMRIETLGGTFKPKIW